MMYRAPERNNELFKIRDPKTKNLLSNRPIVKLGSLSEAGVAKVSKTADEVSIKIYSDIGCP
jgi:hypothetical protein